MNLHITKIVFLHALGSIYEIGIGKSFTQRILIPKLISALTGSPRQPSKEDVDRLNEQAARSI